MVLLYKTIIDRVQRLDAALFDPATAAWQAGPAEWGPATNNRDDAAGIKVLAVTSREQAVRCADHRPPGRRPAHGRRGTRIF